MTEGKICVVDLFKYRNLSFSPAEGFFYSFTLHCMTRTLHTPEQTPINHIHPQEKETNLVISTRKNVTDILRNEEIDTSLV